MGDYRFFLTVPEIVTPDDVAKHFPDHGLIYFDGRLVKLAREAPRRDNPNHQDEVRFLRYAIINRKRSWEPAPDATNTRGRAAGSPTIPKFSK
jgi:hypothetical protein